MPLTFCGWISILVYIYIYTGFTLILRTASLFFPDGQAVGQVAARILRGLFSRSRKEGRRERERERRWWGRRRRWGRERDKGARVVDEFSGLFVLCQLRLLRIPAEYMTIVSIEILFFSVLFCFILFWFGLVFFFFFFSLSLSLSLSPCLPVCLLFPILL